MMHLKKIYVDMSVGLGNLLFDCSHAYTIGKNLNTPIEYHLRTSQIFRDKKRGTQYDEWVKGEYSKIFKKFDIQLCDVNTNEIDGTYIKTSIKNFCINPEQYFNNENIIISGCWASFEDLNLKEIQDLFKIDNKIKEELEKKYCNILKSDNLVSIHVRRGDFLNYQSFTNLLDDTDYYQKAIKLCNEDNTFIVVSDDIDYCKNKFKHGDFKFIENTTPLEDLYIQTYCQTNIIANSTFSHWGAYLNKMDEQKIIKPLNCSYNLSKENTKIITI